jgi:serine/threonine-protein kinase
MADRLRTFLGELKRRKVYHVGLAYVAVAAGVLGVCDAGIPDALWARLQVPVGILLLVGFPIALVLAWAYEVRPEESAGTESAIDPVSQEDPTHLPLDRIAVLPFASIHPDREHDYFADGITEELISAISRVRGLDVIARTSVMKYRDSDARIGEIARDLNVGVVLEGSVRKAGDQLRVTVQLINAESEGHLWAEDYDREFREIFAVQRDIASHVADALRLRLLEKDAENIGYVATDDLAAYDLYLLGRHHLGLRTDAGTRKAISSFERSIELDSAFAPGHAGLADAHILAALGYMSKPPKDVLQRVQQSAKEALRLNESLPEAHTSLGYSALLAWDAGAALSEFQRAVELNPSHAQAHQWMAHALIVLNRPLEAAESSARALELDPLSAILTLEAGWGYYYAWEIEKALPFADRALAMDPNLPVAHYNRAEYLFLLERPEEAFKAADRALKLLPSMPYGRAFLAGAHARHGQEETAQAMLSQLEAEDSTDNPIRAFIAFVQEALGMKDEALASIRIAVDRREPFGSYISLAWLPFHSLRGDPEFQSIVEEIDRIVGR